jgi:phospholipid/cholesterol/gamma-HCH transport system ATP-binding protein
MISIKNVSKSYLNESVLEEINFSVEAGENISIIGPGGCGKTTLLKLMLGLIPADHGVIELMGCDMLHSTESQRLEVLRRVGMAFQQGALFDYMTVRNNLIFAMEHMTSMTEQEMEIGVTNLLDRVKLGRTANMFPYELSGGMQRRVGIARALATSPTVAIFDEPTSGLDPVTSTIILNMIKDLASAVTGNISVVATTSVEIAIRFAKRLIVINEGRIVADGDWQELLVSGPEWVRYFLGVRLIGIDIEYAKELKLPLSFLQAHWQDVRV